MEQKKIDAIFLITYSIILIATYASGLGTIPKISLFFSIVTPLISIYYSIAAARYFGKSIQGKIAALFAITFSLWLVGDMLWTWIYDSAVSSPADFFYLAAYPIILAAVLLSISLVDSDFFKKNVVWTILTIAIGFAIYNNFFPLNWDSSTSPIDNLVTSGYVFVDFILLCAVIVLIIGVFSGSFAAPWYMIGLGIIFTLIGDIYYALNPETYVSGQAIDVIWYLSYIAFAAGLAWLVHNAKETLDKAMKRNSVNEPKEKKHNKKTV